MIAGQVIERRHDEEPDYAATEIISQYSEMLRDWHIFDRSNPSQLADGARALAEQAYEEGLNRGRMHADERYQAFEKNVSEKLEHLMLQYNRSLGDMSANISKLYEGGDSLNASASEFHRSIRRLRRNLFGARRFAFYVFDLSACLIVSAIAYITLVHTVLTSG